MTDQPDNIVLVYLRRLDEKCDRMAAEIRDSSDRLGRIEVRFGAINRGLDRILARFTKVETNLDLVELPH